MPHIEPSAHHRALALTLLVAVLMLSCASDRLRAPAFSLPSMDGSTFRLADRVSGHVLLITFWSTECIECQSQMSVLAQIQDAYAAQGLLVLAIATDGPRTSARVPSAAQAAGITFPVLLDEDGSVLARYNPRRSVPTTVLVGGDGFIRKRLFGGYFVGPNREWIEAIEGALAEAQGPSAPARSP